MKIRASTSGQTRRSAAVSRPPLSVAGAPTRGSDGGDPSPDVVGCSAVDPVAAARDAARSGSGRPRCRWSASESGGADAMVSRGPAAEVGAALRGGGAVEGAVDAARVDGRSRRR